MGDDGGGAARAAAAFWPNALPPRRPSDRLAIV
jgi:hypothetical protein